jgi:hypothetical protein
VNEQRILQLAAWAEAASLLVLVVNRLTVHLSALAGAIGPLHGFLYLAVIAATFASTKVTRVRLVACIPGIGGLLVLRLEGREKEPATDG